MGIHLWLWRILLPLTLFQGISFSATIPIVKSIDFSVPEETLPYKLDYRIFELPCPETGGKTAADVNGDGTLEFFDYYSKPLAGEYADAIIAYGGPFSRPWTYQYNGPLMNDNMVAARFIDILGDRGAELVMTKVRGDTIFFEILAFSSNGNVADTIVIVAAVSEHFKPGESWHDIRVEPLAGLDVDGDGYRDLIYSRVAKPDSAFARGIIAYDLKRHRQLWSFPTADGSGPDRFAIIQPPAGEEILVAVIISANNSYSANGMDSHHAYVLALNKKGKELWRHTIGDAGFYPGLAVHDMNRDGADEVLVTTRTTDSVRGFELSVKEYDPRDGALLASSPSFSASSGPLWALVDSVSGEISIIMSAFGDTVLTGVKLDSTLQCEIVCRGANPAWVKDLNFDGCPEILAHIFGDRWAVFDKDFKLLACASPSEDIELRFESNPERYTVLPEPNCYKVVGLFRRGFLALSFARYKWHLAVLLSVVLLYGGLRSARWIRGLYRSAAGLPGLDKVDSLVMVLSRKGKIIYVNSHSLAKLFVGDASAQGCQYEQTQLAHCPPLLGLIQKSFRQPLTSLQEQFEIEIDGTVATIAITTYPRLDQSNRFNGKVLIAENVTGRLNWQRKVVLGEAAQRWVHKLKGNLATARIYLENLQEDRRLDEHARVRVLPDYIPAVNDQIRQTAETANKILHFASIGKPEPVRCEINALIDRATEPYLANPRCGLVVAKEQQADLPEISVDPNQIKEVLDNLLSNAIFAMNQGGKLTTSSRLAENLLSKSGRRMVEIVVEDTGVGIDAVDLERIFQPGFSRSGSTGVGLALVKEIVENHGGQIKVESQPGKGSRFIVQLPSQEIE